MIEIVPEARVGLDLEAIRISLEAGSGLDVIIEPDGQMRRIETTFMYRDMALTIRSGLEGELLAVECSLCLHPQIRRNGARWVRIGLEKSGKFSGKILDSKGEAVQEFCGDLDDCPNGTVLYQERYHLGNRTGNYTWEAGQSGLPFSNGVILTKEGHNLMIRVNTERGNFLAVKLAELGSFFESETWIGLLTTPTEASLRGKVLAQLQRMFEVETGQLEWASSGNGDGEANLEVFERALAD
ncbi:MAG: hypothetical protein WAV56_01045 [Microgenomates group bacterium]